MPCSSSSAASSASGSGSNRTTRQRETIVSSWTSADVPIRIRTEPGGGSSRVLRKALAASSLRSSASSTIATLRGAAHRLQAEVEAEVADHRDRQLVLVLGPRDLEQVGVGAGLDLEAARAGLAGVEAASSAALAEQGLRQRQREGALADPLGPDEEEGVREPPLAQAAAGGSRRPGHVRGPSARARSTSLRIRRATVSGSAEASMTTIGAG